MRRETRHAAGVVLFRTDVGARKYLLLRSALTRRPVWEFPKGGLELGETARQAAERELREETGLAESAYAIQDGFREERYMFTAGSGEARTLIDKRVVYFLAESFTDTVRISREASEYQWASAADAHRLLRFAQKRRVLATAEQWLSDGSG